MRKKNNGEKVVGKEAEERLSIHSKQGACFWAKKCCKNHAKSKCKDKVLFKKCTMPII
jgi:hypothetical protein